MRSNTSVKMQTRDLTDEIKRLTKRKENNLTKTFFVLWTFEARKEKQAKEKKKGDWKKGQRRAENEDRRGSQTVNRE